jgi:hypothetical protein
MFQSYKFNGYLDEKVWEYELTDSEFGIVLGIAAATDKESYFSFEIPVIQEYSKLNLNVAANLVMAFIWYNKQFPRCSIQEIINYNKKHNPLFLQYEKDLQKYLVLL